jgi:cytochrome c
MKHGAWINKEQAEMKVFVLAAAALAASIGVAQAQDASAGETTFNRQCKACHALGAGARNLVGPVLNGLDGRKSGSVDNYSYSDANKNSGITWSDATFKKYIENPAAMIPKTKMAFAGVKAEKDRDNLWAYLKQFKADGSK